MMPFDIVVLNGGSSSGKSTIALCLQSMLPRPWLRLSVDDLIDAMPTSLESGEQLIDFTPDGAVVVHDAFRRLETAWHACIAAIATNGVGVLVEDVFLGGADSQDRLRRAFDGLRVCWVGVHCAADVAESRELERMDRTTGMARQQADAVHVGVHYDAEVDTTRTSATDCARAIAARLS